MSEYNNRAKEASIVKDSLAKSINNRFSLNPYAKAFHSLQKGNAKKFDRSKNALNPLANDFIPQHKSNIGKPRDVVTGINVEDHFSTNSYFSSDMFYFLCYTLFCLLLSAFFYNILNKENNDNLSYDLEPGIHSPLKSLQNIRNKNLDRIIIGHLNINSVRNKIHILSDIVAGKIDIFLISETKIDDSFPNAQFLIHHYSEPHRLDRNKNGGGLLLYVRKDITTKRLPLIITRIECIITEIIISKRKWLLLGFFNPDKSTIVSNIMILEQIFLIIYVSMIISLY